MKEKKKILAISGSTKKASSNQVVLQFIKNHFKDSLEVDIFSDIDKLPHFNPELDTENPPEAVQSLREKIQSADGVIICTPEYVFSLPGSLKNAIEWNVSTTVFSGKPVAIIVAAASGQKAFESLELIMTTIESKLDPGAKLLIQGVKGKVGSNGDIKDKDTAKQIIKLTEALKISIEADDRTPSKYLN